MKVGIIGLGYVGRAVQNSWTDTEHEVIFHDPYLPGSIPLPALVDLKPSIIFICVPTPAKEDGSCDTSIVKEKANRYSYEGKMANYSFLKKVDRKVVDKQYSISFSEFKKLYASSFIEK